MSSRTSLCVFLLVASHGQTKPQPTTSSVDSVLCVVNEISNVATSIDSLFTESNIERTSTFDDDMTLEFRFVY